jgi:hypothetical protein
MRVTLRTKAGEALMKYLAGFVLVLGLALVVGVYTDCPYLSERF